MSGAQAKLLASVASGNVNHAYLVVSSSGDIASILSQCAKVLLCAEQGCGVCDVCAKIDKDVHNDSILLPRDRVKNKLNVEDISYLIEESYKRPVDNSSCRVFLIDATNSMGGTVGILWQNKLLKTLEEPVGDCHILIGVRSSQGVLPTVLSRCQLLVDEGAGYSYTLSHLLSSGYKQELARLASTVSQGNIDSALAIVADPSYYSLYQLLLDMLCHMRGTGDSLSYVSRILAQDSYKDKLLLMLTCIMRDAIVCRVDSTLNSLDVPLSIMQEICSNYSVTACVAIVELINKVNSQLSAGVNYNIVVDKLIVNMLEEKYRCRI